MQSMDDPDRFPAALERATRALEEATAEMRSLRTSATDLRYSTERLRSVYALPDHSRVLRLADRRP
jgi:multidrug resistance efflux pump